MLATIQDQYDASDVRALFEAWQPLIAILALPSCLTRKERHMFLRGQSSPFKRPEYTRVELSCHHPDFGGVTSSTWHFVHYSRSGGPTEKDALMMAPQFPRPLQTALDDTLGESRRATVVVEEAQTATPTNELPHILGFAPTSKVKYKTPVFDASRRGPDIGSLTRAERNFWVSANSVYR